MKTSLTLIITMAYLISHGARHRAMMKLDHDILTIKESKPTPPRPLSSAFHPINFVAVEVARLKLHLATRFDGQRIFMSAPQPANTNLQPATCNLHAVHAAGQLSYSFAPIGGEGWDEGAPRARRKRSRNEQQPATSNLQPATNAKPSIGFGIGFKLF